MLPTKIQLLSAFEIVSKAFLESLIVVFYLKGIQIQTERKFFENPLFISRSIFVEIKGEATSRQTITILVMKREIYYVYRDGGENMWTPSLNRRKCKRDNERVDIKWSYPK